MLQQHVLFTAPFMNHLFAAARMRLATNKKAEAEKIIQIKRAEGEAESKYVSGVGITW